MKDVDLIALAGLLHDIGKFGQRAEIDIDLQSYDKNLYCPFFNGYHSHIHAIYSADFLKNIVSKQNENTKPLPALIDNESFENISARHHRVYDNGTPKEWIVAMADRIASGFERDEFDKYNKSKEEGNFKEIRLDSIFDESKKYPLDIFNENNIFSVENYKGSASEYSKLYKKFEEELQVLLKKPKSNFIKGIDFLLKKYTSFIPSSTYMTKANIPLYDHLKTTAVFASALYAYHKDKMDIEQIKDYNQEKFLLIAGDFFGIQNFIFSDLPTKHAAKILRGKSAFIQIFTKVVALYICEKLELSTLSIISDSAGKFEILAPNNDTTIQKLEEIKKSLNEWFLKETFGESGIGISTVKTSAMDFTSGKFQTFRENLAKQVEASKFHKFDLQNQNPVFDIQTKDNAHLCKKCNKRFKNKESDESCKFCDKFITIGEKLAKSDALQITKKKTSLAIFEDFYIDFNGYIDDDSVEVYDISKNNELFNGLPKWELKSYVKFSEVEDRIEEFGELALESCEGKEEGVKALMALKGDVDNMGEFLKNKDINSFAKFNFISRLIDYFFSVKVSKMMEGENIYTVFAGGDDLFVIGAWDEVITLSKKIRDEFMKFCESEKSKLSISMGMVMIKPSKPINFVAQASEEALEKAKELKGKDAVSLFGETVKWDDYLDDLGLSNELEQIDDINTAFTYRLLELIQMSKNVKYESIIQDTMWKSKLAYSFQRNMDKKYLPLLNTLNKMIEEYPKESKMVISEFIYKRRRV
jgi:CRISPR-associated protein Csm1